jgi:hypothetical protein
VSHASGDQEKQGFNLFTEVYAVCMGWLSAGSLMIQNVRSHNQNTPSLKFQVTKNIITLSAIIPKAIDAESVRRSIISSAAMSAKELIQAAQERFVCVDPFRRNLVLHLPLVVFVWPAFEKAQ